MQQDTNGSNETTVKETGGYDKNSVRKDIINLKNDMQEIKEALKSLLTKQWQSKHEQEIPYQPEKKTVAQKKENKTKLKKEILSDDTTEKRENKDKLEEPSKKKKGIKENIRRSKDSETSKFITKMLKG